MSEIIGIIVLLIFVVLGILDIIYGAYNQAFAWLVTIICGGWAGYLIYWRWLV